MCAYIGTYLYFQLNGTPLPDFMRQINVWVSWGFLIVGAFFAARVIVDCLQLSARGEMSASNVRDGILLALLHFLPVVLMSGFMLKEGFVGK